MKKGIAILGIILTFIINTINVKAEEPKIPQDYSVILIDAKSGQSLFEHNADVRVRPASTTKLMTAILACENGKLNDEMKISKEAVNDIGSGGMNIGLMPGETNITLEVLLNIMLIKSANETANIAAENIGGSKAKFAEMMNKKAVELGANNTFFVNPCGKDDAKEDANHLTTARDMSKIARYAMTIPKIKEIVSKEYYKDIPKTNKHDSWAPLRTTNKLLWDTNSYPYTINGEKHMFKVTGMKTGFTSLAGNNLVSSATAEDGTELICVLMHVTDGASKNRIFNLSKDILKYGFENYSMQKVLSKGEMKNITVEVKDSKGSETLELIPASDLESLMRRGTQIGSLDPKIVKKDNITAPINEGDVLGSIEYENNGVSIGKVDLIATKSIEKYTIEDQKRDNPSWYMKHKYKLMVGPAVIVFFLMLRFTLKRISAKRRAQKYKLRW